VANTKSSSRSARRKQKPAQAREAAPTHDAFFKQTLADKTLAAQFLRERLPERLAALLGPEDAVQDETESVDDALRRLLADKVLRVPLIDGSSVIPYFVLDQKSEGNWLAIAQLARYCFAIIGAWYRQERRKEKESPPEAREPMPVVVGVIVHSGPSSYAHQTELKRLAGPIHENFQPFMPNLQAAVVDLRTIEDQALSAHPVLRARLLVQKHATDRDLRGKLDSVLAGAGIEQLPDAHASDIISFLGARVGGLEAVTDSLKRIAPQEKAEQLMQMTVESIKEQGRAESRKQAEAQIESFKAQARAELEEAKARVEAQATAELDEAKAQARAEVEEAKAQVEALQDQTRQTLMSLVEQRIGRVLPAEVRERIASASISTLNGWLSNIAVKNSLESLLASDQSDPSTHTNGAKEHPDTPVNGSKPKS
jgi:F0F1-type ATP synthase membrane subunit b/b'